MKREALLSSVRDMLTDHRFRHTLGVVETAIKLATRFGADREKAELAAILHDCAKYWPEEEMRDIIRKEPELPDDLLDYDKELWHAPVGSVIIQRQFAVTDPDIIAAVRYHTTGRVGMTLLEKIVCLADYIEPNRKFPGVDDIRALAEHDLNLALAMALGGTIRFLIENRKRVYPLTLLTYNDLLASREERR